RETLTPYLGLCFGLQLAVVEYARNVCGLEGAHTTEIDPDTPHPVVDILPEQRKLIEEEKYGGTMRLGSYPAVLRPGTLVHKLYGRDVVYERHRHRYEVNPEYHGVLQEHGLVFSGMSPDGRLVEFIELPEHPFFVGTQAHPEFKSRFLKPHPLFKGFLEAAHRRKVGRSMR
ncbi:MAG: CTP synthase, partial [Thermoproteota archaeon]